ncbi:MAG: hypothetical protein Q4B26_11965 [Eubacteriales bacterium]|nr:hypothetical protein [Eubacteriales bacterium]
MERYELRDGKVFEIIRFSDEYAVAENGTILYAGTYADCRRFIEGRKKRR